MGLPRSSFTAWSKHQHRLTHSRAASILTSLGTSWQAFRRAGSVTDGAGVMPATVHASWCLLQALQAALPKIEVDLLLRAAEDAIIWIRFDGWHVAIQSDGWASLFRGDRCLMEGRLCHALQGEFVRAVLVVRHKAKPRLNKPLVFVSNLHSGMRAIHSGP